MAYPKSGAVVFSRPQCARKRRGFGFLGMSGDRANGSPAGIKSRSGVEASLPPGHRHGSRSRRGPGPADLGQWGVLRSDTRLPGSWLDHRWGRRTCLTTSSMIAKKRLETVVGQVGESDVWVGVLSSATPSIVRSRDETMQRTRSTVAAGGWEIRCWLPQSLTRPSLNLTWKGTRCQSMPEILPLVKRGSYRVQEDEVGADVDLHFCRTEH